eukprot:TRINITY_DN66664_c8_g3_i1.p1 TRINITY_DN66664_c8_g3~~TRINITY_DN66664_c8_g3_i1.p1  ORF type:complete len:270 (+),score=0.21 TRINITY_DN66664_c8_g3_i1:23-832(+)
MTSTQNQKLNIIMLGPSGVGKTSLMFRFAGIEFNEHESPTIGIEFTSVILDLNGTRVEVRIWDTAGQEKFRAITRQYYNCADGVMLVYDCTSRSTFDSGLTPFLDDMKKYCRLGVQVMLVANKVDMHSSIAVPVEAARTFAKQNFINFFFETSAKEGTKVFESFQALAKATWLQKQTQMQVERPQEQCSRCATVDAEHFCEQCNQVFCKKCWAIEHKNMTHHTSHPIAEPFKLSTNPEPSFVVPNEPGFEWARGSLKGNKKQKENPCAC